jgi:flagellar protein FlgJ
MKVTDFVKTYYPFALKMEKEYHVPALVAMAQSALETGWGRSAPGNMMFGMKVGKWKGAKQLLLTTEYHKEPDVKYPEVISVVKINGKYKYRVKDWFRAYPTPYESFEDYAILLRNSSRYLKAFDYIDPYKFAEEIAKAGYATAPDYYKRIKSVIDLIKRYI